MAVAAVKAERVEQALRQAASATGVDFAYLLKTARRESSLNPAAKARTSSAAGLFQFIEQTWLGTMKKHGAKHGYGGIAAQIRRAADGRLSVADPAARQRILDLRYDAKASSLMGAELASDSAAYLRGRIGREPTGGELYLAHFLGPAGSARLIQAAERQPEATAARLFPAAAGANRPIFYRQGRALSVAEVYAKLTDGAAAPAVPAREPLPVNVQVASTPVEAGPRLPETFDATRSALARLDRTRSQSMLIEMVLGETRAAAFGGSPFSPELLNLLTTRPRV